MKKWTKGRVDILLIIILLFSAGLNFYNLQNAGTNSYYSVAVKSMLTSFHNFFFVSFDPAGFITVDKPPVALWIQAIFAYIFGFNDFVLLLPEALAGVVSVFLLYLIVKPKFGRNSALISSLVLACSPIFVAVVRTNNVDSILLLTLMTATWALMKAVEKQKLGWLILSFALVGVGFNVKMMQAFMVLPAFFFYYFFATREIKMVKKIINLVISTVVLAVISLSWAVAVDLTPESERPYMGGSETNSVLELALGYNGLSRLTGNNSGGGSSSGQQEMPTTNSTEQTQNSDQTTNSNSNDNSESSSTNTQNNEGTSSSSSMQDGGGNPPSGQGGMMNDGSSQNSGMFNTGDAGPLRLFQSELSGQISWLLPFVLFAVIGLVVTFLKTRRYTMQHHFSLFWLAWLMPMMVFFSIALFYHHYYLSMMAPAIAALIGIGFTTLFNFYKEEKGWESWLLPVGILVTSLFEALIVYQNSSSVSIIWMWVGIILGVVLFMLLVAAKSSETIKHTIAIASILSLLVLPIYWTAITITKTGNESTPTAGPTSAMGGGRGGGMQGGPGSDMGVPGGMQGGSGGNMTRGTDNADDSNNSSNSSNSTNNQGNASQMQGGTPPSDNGKMGGGEMDGVDTELMQYLEENYNGEKFFLAVQRAQSAYSIMLNTDYAVMAMGGFGGSDPAPTVEELEKMADDGEIKYFLISGQGMGGSGNSDVTSWIQENCEEVPSSEYSDDSSDNSSSSDNTDNTDIQNQRGGSSTLYVYKGK
ncbi:glycosyltransferase family 39 protein [Niallia nealsonii]|uniref:Glycosyl transferase n=1 Tax=Niallia nealsonii TaxID=115979 RepID=A0A2N0YX45_9BACI|nr:glycosyltransferase family 39 protein [Niallia nealsonii]PKG21820.1 glycosyl transferase [Niallia nealsonii]